MGDPVEKAPVAASMEPLSVGGAVPGRLGSDGPVGISGWLILPAIHLFITPVILLGDLIWLGSHEGAAALVRMPALAGAAGLIEVVLLMFALNCLARFVGKKANVRTLMIVFYCLTAIYGLLSLRWGSSIVSMIWIFYFMKSRRVENTFVN